MHVLVFTMNPSDSIQVLCLYYFINQSFLAAFPENIWQWGEIQLSSINPHTLCPMCIICLQFLKHTTLFHASVPVLHADLIIYNILLPLTSSYYLQNLARMLCKWILWFSYHIKKFITLSLCKISIPFIHCDHWLHIILLFYLQVCILSRL